MEEATRSYEEARMADADVAMYLMGRGITPDVADTFRVGVVKDPLPGHGRFRNFLSIPYLDRDSKPLSMRFRCLQQHDCRDFGHGKYMSITDEPARMFNIRAIHEAMDVIHVAEGELDALVLTMCGMPAVAIPGAALWAQHHRRMLAGFNRVWVWGDPDDAGADFTNRLTRSMRQAKGVRLRDGDVTETYLLGGAEALHALVRLETV